MTNVTPVAKMSCEHWRDSSRLVNLSSKPKVYKKECMYCFNNWEEPGWIEVCAGCFQGFCMEHINFHMATHSAHQCCVKASMRTMVIVEDENRNDAEGNAAVSEREFQLKIPGQKVAYDYTFIPFCYRCQNQLNIPPEDPLLKYITESVEASKVQTYSWSDEIKACSHINSLQQSLNPRGNKLSCSSCDVKENLWMCLSCGVIGCGRRQADGSGGNGHASQHFSESKHPCSVKLGTIRNACPDVHCYECDDMVLDSSLAEHLETLKVDISSIPAEKGMAELQWEQNQNFDFSMSTDDGKQFEKAIGYPGISNLGNSCYLSSIVQPLVRLIDLPSHDISNCSLEPKDCTLCQFEKIKNALLNKTNQGPKIQPWMFKQLVGSGHSEFSSTRQQDAAEFFTHILKALKAYEPFAFDLQQTLLCPECGFTRSSITRCDYLQTDISQAAIGQVCSLNKLIESFFAPEIVQLKCTKCGQPSCTKRFGIVSGPKECLAIVIGRSAVENGIPIKLDSSIMLPKEIDISEWIEPAIEFVPDKDGLDQLTNMGFSVQQATAALKQSDNKVETALNDLLSGKVTDHSSSTINEEDLLSLISMGFDEELAQKALEKVGNREAACELLLSSPESLFEENVSSSLERNEIDANASKKYSLSGIVSHKGPSLHCGHYIAHVLDDSGWLLYNDERVVRVTEDSDTLPDTSKAYIAFYIRN